jgi:alanine racemase
MGPTLAHISHINLRHNLALIRQAIGSTKIMAVVKAFAYGHGDVEIAGTACDAGCEYLGVAFVEEGIRLRQAGIDVPILVFGAQLPPYLKMAVDYNLDLTVTSLEQLAYLKNLSSGNSKKIAVHLKIDTGMNRLGFPSGQFEEAYRMIGNHKRFLLAGIYSHLSTADERDQTYLNWQIARFSEIQAFVKANGKEDVLFHLANSAAIMKKPESYFDMVRPGIMIYGQPPSPDFDLDWDLKPVLSLRSKLGLIKFIRKNEPISYGRRYYTKTDSYIGVVPVGYADGLNRGLTNKADVIINNRKYPLVGTVCMDMIMVNLGKVLECKTGDEVIIYGESEDQQITIRDISKELHTIPYEITCSISARVPRKHIYS